MSESLHPEVESLFRQAELTDGDVRRIKAIQDEHGFVCAHGSGITGHLSKESDIDFLVVTHKLQERMATEYGIEGAQVDYESSNIIGEKGRKISLHYAEENFRTNYGQSPIAVEFRAASNKKKTAQSQYSLAGIGKEGYYVVKFGCPKVILDDRGTYNFTPQTGYFELNGHQGVPIMDGVQDHHLFNIIEKQLVDPVTGQIYDASDMNDEVLLLGLESNKATNDIPITAGRQEDYDKYVTPVLSNTVAMFANHLQKDPVDEMITLMRIHGDYRNREAGRQKVDPAYIQNVIRPRIEEYVAPHYRK